MDSAWSPLVLQDYQMAVVSGHLLSVVAKNAQLDIPSTVTINVWQHATAELVLKDTI